MLTRIKIWLGLVGIFVVTLWASWLKGVKSAENKAKVKDLTDYKDTRERMDEVSPPTDANSAREWLRKRGE
jgi:hypothetical protein